MAVALSLHRPLAIATGLGLALLALLAGSAPAAAQQDPDGFILRDPNDPTVEPPNRADPLTVKDMQIRRRAFVEEAIRQKIFIRFSDDLPTCEVWVGPRFARLREIHKIQAASIPWTYCRALSERADILLLRDGQTDKQIGMFTQGGLKLF